MIRQEPRRAAGSSRESGRIGAKFKAKKLIRVPDGPRNSPHDHEAFDRF
jgi:hypothetical protein